MLEGLPINNQKVAKKAWIPPIRPRTNNKLNISWFLLKRTGTKDPSFLGADSGTVPKEVFKRIKPKIAPKPKRKPIGDYITDVRPKPQLGAGTEFAVKPPKSKKIVKAPEEDSPAAYHAAKAAKIKAEPKPKKVKPTLWGSEKQGTAWFKKHFPNLEVEYTYPEEINDKKGGYLKKDLKKAKARRRAALRGHRKELRGGWYGCKFDW